MLMFWDYDTQWGADRSRAPGGHKQWGLLEFENTERLLELLDEYSIKTCFAVVGSAALPGERPYHDPKQIQQIHKAGHEVASHSHRHEWLPGLGPEALRETLQRSKDALEQCIGDSVVSFVPPYNQPFDHVARWSFSLSERREARITRTDLKRLCEALAECGYRFCRVAYRTLLERLVDVLAGEPISVATKPECIAGITCIRVGACGFAERARRLLMSAVRNGGWVVVYGHPHSLYSGNTQDVKYLRGFLRMVAGLRREGLLRVCLPRDIVAVLESVGG